MQPAYVPPTPCTYAEKKLGCVPNRIPMASTYGPFDLVPDVLVPWRNPYMGELMDYARQKPTCAFLGTLLGTRCPPVGLVSWVEHDVAKQKQREDATIEWPFVPLLLELGGGVVVFRLALFPLMMWLFTKFFERQSFWERISARQSAYGVPESVEAVWGGVIGLWHAITAAGLLYGWSLHPDAAYTSVATAMHGGHSSLDESMFWFRRFVCLEV